MGRADWNDSEGAQLSAKLGGSLMWKYTQAIHKCSNKKCIVKRQTKTWSGSLAGWCLHLDAKDKNNFTYCGFLEGPIVLNKRHT